MPVAPVPNAGLLASPVGSVSAVLVEEKGAAGFPYWVYPVSFESRAS